MQANVKQGPAIIVMGVSGSGKSTVGPELGKLLGFPYLEGDEFHPEENISKMRRGIALEDADRWPWLDLLGNRIKDYAVDFGGGVASCSALKRGYRDRLRSSIGGQVIFVHLSSPALILGGRVAGRAAHYMPVSLLESQLASLEPPGSDEQAITVLNENSIEWAVHEALDKITKIIGNIVV